MCGPVRFYLGTVVDTVLSANAVLNPGVLLLNLVHSRHWPAQVLNSPTKHQGME